jgi:hypothetical protein
MGFGYFLYLCVGCSSGLTDSTKDSSNTLDASEYTFDATFDDLFHDQMQFTRDDLISGSTNCSDIINELHIEDAIVTWPNELKDYLLEVLNRFPKPEIISQAVHGIYLVTDNALVDEVSNTTAAGLACDRGSDFKGIIFLNFNTMIRKRNSIGVGIWQNSRTKSNKHVEVSEGDLAAITLMHEIFHAIDIKMFSHGSTADLQKRTNFKNRSWVGNEPKFKKGAIVALNGQDFTDELTRHRRCTHPIHSGFSFANTDADPKSLAEELKDLQDRSNFIVPYSMASPAEDFAETLTVYYFGVFYQSWQKRVVSAGKKPLFVHDTENILRTKPQHIEKTCAAAELIFGECKLN